MKRGVDWSAALDELRLVHRKEQAALLRDAASIACAASRRGDLYVAGLPEARRARWARACADAIAVAYADDAEVEPMLRALAATPETRWPSATDIARASLELDVCVAGLVALARARICEEEPGEAIALLRELAAARPRVAERRDVLEALALALECAGESDESLRRYAAALRTPGCEPRVAVSMLALALRAGNATWIDCASRRLRHLDLAIPGVRARFQHAVRRAVARAALST